MSELISRKKKSDSDVGLPIDKSVSKFRVERLKAAVRDAGGRLAVSEKSGVPVGTLDGYLAGGAMKLDPAAALARALGVSLDWLTTGVKPDIILHDGNKPLEIEVKPSQASMAVSRGLAPEGYVSIPRYEVRASAGRGTINPAERIVDQMILAEEYIRRVLRRRPEDMALLEASGDSMSPTIQDGDVMMIDVSVTELRGSSIYIIMIDGELSVKRLHKLTGGQIILISDNERYPREELKPDQDRLVTIVGQVLWYGRPLPG